MPAFGDYPEIAIDLDQHIATIEIQRGPYNFFHVGLIETLADACLDLDDEPDCRVIVLCAEGKAFCAGAELSADDSDDASPTAGPRGGGHLYEEAVRLFSARTPIVAAVQGAAIGGGFGLAMMADFRVGCPESRFAANFARLGFHQGFGLSVTLPLVLGHQKALDLLYTGRRVKGEEAYEMGICDHFSSQENLRAKAREVATEIARSAPLAVQSIKQTMRGDLPEKIRIATDRELEEQDRLRQTSDFKEGVLATAERRLPRFTGQ